MEDTIQPKKEWVRSNSNELTAAKEEIIKAYLSNKFEKRLDEMVIDGKPPHKPNRHERRKRAAILRKKTKGAVKKC